MATDSILLHVGEVVVVVVVVVKGHLAKIRRETKKIQRGEKMEEGDQEIWQDT